MEYVVIAYLFLSILLYVVLGGADFGAGIIELFTSEKNKDHTRETLYRAIGPIWEANHMWLIITIVILFVAYPLIYAEMSVYLHIPLIIMLIGIIARGTAFVFRNYDAVKDDMQHIYNRIYFTSSFITPLFLGIVAGSVVSGHIDHAATTFVDVYIFSWLNWFSVGVGFFVVALCGFLASVYLIGETDNPDDRKRFINKARHMNIAAVISGVYVFITAWIDHTPLANWIFGTTIGLIAVIAAGISLVILWILIYSGNAIIIRLLAGFQVTMILLALGYAHFPDFIVVKNGTNLTLMDHRATMQTINALGWALLTGTVFIIPALFYLYYKFKHKEYPHD
ncbi:MAG: cytochrome d ubiquinol oxidase subunit II [Cyclobacteriaceae bacterium]